MRVIVAGRDGDRPVRYTYDLYDEYNAADGATSMARTTGYTNTIVARLLAAGRLREPGVFAPEQLAVRDGLLDHVIGELRRRGVEITLTAK
jgi:saccharopine dehydrogenase-like NADP-dependent oxidoreductase